MKTLALYSVFNSIHTVNLYKNLIDSWKIILIAPKETYDREPNFIYKYNEIKSNIIIKTDSDFILSAKKHIIKHPFRSISDFLKYRTEFRKIIHLRRVANSIEKLLKENKCDLLYTHQIDFALIAYFSNFRPYVITFWGSDLYLLKSDLTYLGQMKNCLDEATMIHCMNEEQKLYLIEKFNVDDKKIFVQNFGADITYLKKHFDKGEMRKKLGINEEIILLSTRFSEDKEIFRLDLIIKAFKQLLEEKPDLNVRLIFMNRAIEDEELQNLVKELGLEDKVTFTGFVYGEEYFNYYKIADIFIQCPTHDGASVSVMEALAAGLPIISTPGIGTEINVKNGYNGLFVKERTAEEIKKQISKLLNDKGLLDKLSKNAFDWALTNCDRDVAFQKINQKLKSILENK